MVMRLRESDREEQIRSNLKKPENHHTKHVITSEYKNFRITSNDSTNPEMTNIYNIKPGLFGIFARDRLWPGYLLDC